MQVQLKLNYIKLEPKKKKKVSIALVLWQNFINKNITKQHKKQNIYIY